MAYLYSTGKQNRIYIELNYDGGRIHKPTPYFCKSGGSEPVKKCKCYGCKDAVSWASEIERKIRENTFVVSEYFEVERQQKAEALSNKNARFEDYAYEFMDYHCNTIQDTTEVSYYSVVNQLCIDFGKMKLTDVKPTHVRNFISKYYDNSKSRNKDEDKSNSLKTIKNKFSLLSKIMKSAVADEIITKNPCEAVTLPKGKTSQVDPFEVGEVIRILEWMRENKPQMLAFYALGFYTGMRPGEIMGIRWSDFDFNSHAIKVQRTITKGMVKNTTKTDDYRIIDIVPSLDKYLEWHQGYRNKDSEYLFTTYQGKHFNKSDNLIKIYWKPCLEALEIKYRIPYNMRHTFACMMIDANENLHWIKNMLGHKSLEMLMRVYGNKIHKINNTGKRRGLKFTETITSEQALDKHQIHAKNHETTTKYQK